MNDPETETERQPATIADRLAHEIKRLRLNAGVSQRALAAEIGYSRQYVSMTEWQGANLPSQDLVAAIDNALGANGTLIALRARAKTEQQTTRRQPSFTWLGARPRALPVNTRIEQAGHDVEVSDHPLSDSDMANSDDVQSESVSLPPFANNGIVEDVVDILSRVHKLSRSINPEIIRDLQTNTQLAIEQHETIDHSILGPSLVKERSWIEALLDECSLPSQRQPLFEAGAKNSGLLGYIAVGRGNFPLARAYCREAFQLGALAQNNHLCAWARGL
ncbi:helix-turn-helix domain-containing protein [Nocardia sp. CA-129566]|uniref:helix-turn-helix domain-containing protein n=1 Tax=Nocardia sp. CA-129566 TaxID=3239976 RepID=UPI003D978D38